MEVSYWISLIVSVVSLASSTTIGIYAWKRKHHPGAIPFAIILFSESFWTTGFIFEMLSHTLQARVFWDLFQWLFLPIMTLALISFAFTFSNVVIPYEKIVWRFFQTLMLLFVLLILTNPVHALVISTPRLVSSEIGLTLLYDYTTLDYIFFAFLYGALLVAFIGFLVLSFLSQKVYRLQAVAILVALGILIAGSIYSLFNLPTFFGQRDNTPITFAFSNLIFAWVLFRYQLFDVGTVAHRLVMETISDPVVVVDNYDHVVDFNNAAKQLFGFATANAFDASPIAFTPNWGKLFHQFHDIDTFSGILTIDLVDTEHTLNLTISQIHNQRQLVQGRLFFLRDITAQKQADQKIQYGEESYTKLFNTVKEAIYILSVDGIFLNVNEGAVNMYGYSREELVGKTPVFVSAPGKNDLQAVQAMLDRVFMTGIAEEFEFWGQRKNGEIFPKECIASKGSYFGRDVIITTARDVTERQKIASKLHEHSEEMALINTLNSAFNRGENIERVIKTLSEETRRMFNCDDVVLFLLSENQQHLIMQYTTLAGAILRQVESVIGRKIPPVHIPIAKTTLLKDILNSGQGWLINDPQQLQTLIFEMALTASLSDATRNLIQPLIPQILRLLNFKSSIMVPLIFRGKPIGILDLAWHNYFTEEHLQRVENFSSQITMAIQRKQTEEALLQSEARFRGFFETSSDALFLFDENGYTIEANQAAEKLFQFSHADLLNQSIWQLQQARSAEPNPAVESAIRDHIEEAIRSNAASWNNRITESEIRLPDGNLRHIQKMTFTIPYRDRFRFGTAVRDITDHKRTEAELQRRADFIRTIADNTPGLVAYCTRDLRCTFANQECLIWFGRTPEEIGRIALTDLLGEELFHMNEPYMLEVLRGVDQRFERTLTKPSGELKHTWVQYISHKINNEVQGFFVLVTDISALKQSQAALQASAEKWKTLFSILPVGVSVLGANHEIIDMNPMLEKITKVTSDGLLQGTYNQRQYLRADGTPMLRNEFPSVQAVQNQKIIENVEMGFVIENGSKIWTEVSAAPLPFPDAGCVVVTNDITERKLAENERARLIADLKSKNHELEQFTYAVSHDLKSPLITIRGFLGFLEKDLQAQQVERVNHDIAYINDAVNLMYTLLNELLALSRAGYVINEPQQIPFGEIVDQALKMLAGRIKDKNINVNMASNLAEVRGDRTRLAQVLQNLIENAIKFMGDQPHPQITIGQRPSDKEVIFFISDNGIGLAPESTEHIFGLFNRVDNKTEGTGIGLALVKRIIETHHGKIWVESEGLGKGATFCFTLPDAKSSQVISGY